MQHPFLVALVSIVPGLGYLLLGDLRKAANIWGAFALLGLVYLLAPLYWMSDLSAVLALLLWIVQIVWAVREAKAADRIERGEMTPAREVPPAAAPPGLSRRESQAWKMRNKIEAQLNPGERLMAVAFVTDTSSYSLATQPYLLGVLEDGLILVRMSMIQRPLTVERIPRSRIESFEFKKGMTTDHFHLRLSDRKRPMKLYASYTQRQDSERLHGATDSWEETLRISRQAV